MKLDFYIDSVDLGFSEFFILKVSFILSFRNPSVFNAFFMFQDLTHCSVITTVMVHLTAVNRHRSALF